MSKDDSGGTDARSAAAMLVGEGHDVVVVVTVNSSLTGWQFAVGVDAARSTNPLVAKFRAELEDAIREAARSVAVRVLAEIRSKPKACLSG